MKILSFILSLLICLPLPSFHGQEVVTARRRAPSGGSAPTFSINCIQGSPTNPHVISGINTVGANAIYLAVTSFDGVSVTATTAGAGTLIAPHSDGNSPSSQFVRWLSPSTSASETFTVNFSGLSYDTVCIILVTGIAGTDSGSNNNVTAGSTCNGSTCQPGSLTPSGAGYQVVIACNGVYTPTGAPTVNSSFTGLAYQPGTGGSAYGEGCAGLVQASSAPVNPTFTWTNGAATPGGIITAVH